MLGGIVSWFLLKSPSLAVEPLAQGIQQKLGGRRCQRLVVYRSLPAKVDFLPHFYQHTYSSKISWSLESCTDCGHRTPGVPSAISMAQSAQSASAVAKPNGCSGIRHGSCTATEVHLIADIQILDHLPNLIMSFDVADDGIMLWQRRQLIADMISQSHVAKSIDFTFKRVFITISILLSISSLSACLLLQLSSSLRSLRMILVISIAIAHQLVGGWHHSYIATTIASFSSLSLPLLLSSQYCILLSRTQIVATLLFLLSFSSY